MAASGNSPLSNHTDHMPPGCDLAQTGCTAHRVRRNGAEATAAWSDLSRHGSGKPKTTAAKRALSPDVMTLQARVCCRRSLSESVDLNQDAAASSPSMRLIGCPLAPVLKCPCCARGPAPSTFTSCFFSSFGWLGLSIFPVFESTVSEVKVQGALAWWPVMRLLRDLTCAKAICGPSSTMIG